nr:hypothetical protein [Frankia gtarii]
MIFPSGRPSSDLAAGDEAAAAVLWWVGPGLHIGPVGLLNVPAGDPTAARVGTIRAVAFGPDGRSVYTAGAAGRIRVFSGPNLLHLTHTATMGVGNDPMTALAVAPKGALVAAGGNLFAGVPLFDPAANTASTAFTDPSDGDRPLTFLDEGAATWSVAFSPDGRHLASGSADGALRVWEIPGPALIGRHGDQQSSEVNPRTGDVVTVSYRAAELWNVTDPYRPTSLSAITDDLADDGDVTNSATFHPDGRLLAVATAKRVCLYDITDPRRPSMISTFAGPAGGVFTLRFSPDGRTLVLGGLGAPPASRFSVERRRPVPAGADHFDSRPRQQREHRDVQPRRPHVGDRQPGQLGAGPGRPPPGASETGRTIEPVRRHRQSNTGSTARPE